MSEEVSKEMIDTAISILTKKFDQVDLLQKKVLLNLLGFDHEKLNGSKEEDLNKYYRETFTEYINVKKLEGYNFIPDKNQLLVADILSERNLKKLEELKLKYKNHE